MKRAAICALLLACRPASSPPLDALGPMRSFAIAEDTQSPARVALFMARGRLTVMQSGSRTLTAMVRTNLPAFAPVVERTSQGLELAQRTRDVERDWPKGARADWQLALGTTPMDLVLLLHTVESELDLGGLSLRTLRLRGDAGAVTMSWQRPNRVALSLDIATYVGPIVLRRLGQSGVVKVRVRNMVGPITIDFGARVERDVAVDIETVVSPIKVIVPKSAAARAVVRGGIVHAPGWRQDGDAWHAGHGRPSVTLRIKGGQAPVKLALRP